MCPAHDSVDKFSNVAWIVRGGSPSGVTGGLNKERSWGVDMETGLWDAESSFGGGCGGCECAFRARQGMGWHDEESVGWR